MFMGATGDFSPSKDSYYDMMPDDYVLVDPKWSLVDDPVFTPTPPIVDYPPTTYRDIRIAEKDKTPVPIPTAKSNQTTYLIAGAIALYFLMG